MRSANPIAGLLTDVVYGTCWGNPWHRLAVAAEDLTDDMLGYHPIPHVHSVLYILRHISECAEWYADGLAERTDDPSEVEWDALRTVHARKAADAMRAVDTACRKLHARARRMQDEELRARCSVWNQAYKAFVLMDGAILHSAWHFGQISMLCRWHEAGRKAAVKRPSGSPGKEGRRPKRDWEDFAPTTRKELCLRLLRAAYEESPWHALRPRVEGISPDELAWTPFGEPPPGELPWSPYEGVPGPAVALHVAHCKVIYAEHALGEAALSWEDCDRVLGRAGVGSDGERIFRILDRAQEFLLDHLDAASSEQLERTYPMPHGLPQTGWQVVATMAQHDAWHAGQIALLRAAFRSAAKCVTGGGQPSSPAAFASPGPGQAVEPDQYGASGVPGG